MDVENSRYLISDGWSLTVVWPLSWIEPTQRWHMHWSCLMTWQTRGPQSWWSVGAGKRPYDNKIQRNICQMLLGGLSYNKTSTAILQNNRYVWWNFISKHQYHLSAIVKRRIISCLAQDRPDWMFVMIELCTNVSPSQGSLSVTVVFHPLACHLRLLPTLLWSVHRGLCYASNNVHSKKTSLSMCLLWVTCFDLSLTYFSSTFWFLISAL